MEIGYPKISKKGSIVTVKLNSEKEFRRTGNVDYTLDANSKTQELIGIEVVNLMEKTGAKNPRLENFEGLVDGVKWKVSYKPEYDVAYVGFQKEEVASAKTKQAKGAVLINLEGNVIGLEVEVIP